MWNCLQFGHLYNIVLPLKVESGGDVPNLDGYEDRMDYEELTEPVLDPEELPKDLKLLLFFDDLPDMKPNPFLF